MERFNATTMVTKDVPEEFVVQAFMFGKNHQFLKYNLIDKPSSYLLALYKKARPFVECDESKKAKVQAQQTSTQTLRDLCNSLRGKPSLHDRVGRARSQHSYSRGGDKVIILVTLKVTMDR